MSGPISSKISAEWSRGSRILYPDTAQRGRGILPSFADASHIISDIESVTVSLATPALTSGQTTTVTKTASLQTINGVNVAKFDTGRIIFTNLSVVAPTNVIASHPTIQVVTNQGNPQVGELTSGTNYTNVRISVSCTLYATGAASAGTLTVSGTAILIGAPQDV